VTDLGLAGESLSFPLTCAWCRNEPATHLLVVESKHSRSDHLVCADCAHRDRERARDIAKAPALVWLWRLAADNCEPAESAVRAQLAGTEITHQCPPGDGGLMPCCGLTPFEVPRYHRMTEDPALVTCAQSARNSDAPPRRA
jgi:hypothetical protein